MQTAAFTDKDGLDLPHDKDPNHVRLFAVPLEQSRHHGNLGHATSLAGILQPFPGTRRQLQAHDDALMHDALALIGFNGT